MKKLFTFTAMLCLAVTMNATITEMTCSEAAEAALALQNGQTGTDSVAITGYVTNTNGTLSRGQQTFWLDDEKGSAQTFQAYWCNIPEEVALNVGDKVTIKGFLMNFFNANTQTNTPEMKNGDTEILERVVIRRDTIDATICEVVEEGEALNSMEITNDFFIVEGIVSSVSSPLNQYKQETFSFICEDNNKELKVYNILMEDSVPALVGDKVEVFGRIQNYNGTIELISGTARVLEKGNVTIDTISVTVSEAVAVVMTMDNNEVSTDIYAVTGYVDSIATAYNEQYNNISFFMTDDMSAPTYDFEAYRVTVTAQQAEKIVVGAKVKVTAALQRYYRAATETQLAIDLAETVAGGELEIVAENAVDNVTNDAVVSKRLENGQLIIIRNGERYNITGVNVQ